MQYSMTGSQRGTRLRAIAALLSIALLAAAYLVFVKGKPAWHQLPRSGAAPGLTTYAAPPPLPVPAPLLMKPIAPAEAISVNQAIPFSTEPLEASRSFKVVAAAEGLGTRENAIECLTAAVYYEAAGEGEQGERAVAQVVLNRVRHPAFPATVCGVVYQGAEGTTGCQFSFTCDGSLARVPNKEGWARAKRIAAEALDGRVEAAVGMATHYHADYVVPYWAGGLTKLTAIGRHIFYRWNGYWGKRAAFNQRYLGEISTNKSAETVLADAAGLIDAQEATRTGLSAPEHFSRLVADAIPSSAKIRDEPQPKLRADETRGSLAADESKPTLQNAPELTLRPSN